MPDDEAPLTTRGVRRTRFDPLRDAPRAKKADLAGVELEFGDLDAPRVEAVIVEGVNDRGEGPFDEGEVAAAISAVGGQNPGFTSDFEPGVPFSASEALISAVRRQIEALGLSASVEGNAAIVAAEKAADATGSAAAACLHELRMAMNEIRTSKPAETTGDPTEDVLSRRRKAKGA